MAEGDGPRVPAVLAADAHLEVGAGRPAPLNGQPHDLAHPIAVEGGKGVVFQDALPQVAHQEARLGVVPADAEGGLVRSLVPNEKNSA